MSFSASTIANYLGLDLVGHNPRIVRASSLKSHTPNSMLWLKSATTEGIANVNASIDCLAIVPSACEGKIETAHVLSSNPKYDFARALQQFFALRPDPVIDRTAVIHSSVKLGNRVSVGHFCLIEENVEVGEGTIIGSHSVIRHGTILGKNCWLKSHTVIGEQGFGFAFNGDEPFRMEHLGNVIIGDNVEIGSFTSVMRGTLGPTQICDGVKIDDLVLIAHNVTIHKNTVIAGGATVAGSVEIGENSWIGAHTSILNGLSLGSGVLVGLGSTVIRNLKENEVVIGEPARHLRNRGLGERFA